MKNESLFVETIKAIFVFIYKDYNFLRGQLSEFLRSGKDKIETFQIGKLATNQKVQKKVETTKILSFSW